jgi:transaldolase
MIITNAWIRTLVHDNNLEVYVIMKFFIDTANVDYIKEANDMGIICGVTTNPSLIAKEGRVFEEVIAEIASIVDGPISGEVKATTTDAETMVN